MNIFLNEINSVSSRLNVDLEENELQRAISYLMQLRNKNLAVRPESLATHSLELACNDFLIGFPLKEAVDNVGASLHQYVSDHRIISEKIGKVVEFSFSSIAVFLGCTKLTGYCERVMDAYQDWHDENATASEKQSIDWDNFNVRLGIFMAVCDAVGFKVPQEYRNQLNMQNNITKTHRYRITTHLHDLLAQIKNEKNLKSIQRKGKGVSKSIASAASVPTSAADAISVKKTHDVSISHTPVVTGSPSLTVPNASVIADATSVKKTNDASILHTPVVIGSPSLTVPNASVIPAWRVKHTKREKRITTGINHMRPVEDSGRLDKLNNWISKIVQKIDEGQIKRMDREELC